MIPSKTLAMVQTAVHHDNIDAVLLLTGDGDYIPLIEEIKRSAKQCYVSAFSDGLHPDLPLIADRFYCLDGTMFPHGAPTGAQPIVGPDGEHYVP